MAISITSRIRNAWNAFLSKNANDYSYYPPGRSYYYRPDRPRFTKGNVSSIITPIYNRIALDVCSVTINHVQLDDDGRFLNIIDSTLNTCLTLSSNIDQTGRAFIQDVVISMLDEGVVAIVPVDVDTDPTKTDSYKILSMRTGKIVAWYPDRVRVRLYDDRTGEHGEITLPKKNVAIVENPFYSVMNEQNSTVQRLIRKLNLLDAIDEQSGSGKLDIIVQLPYAVKSEAQEQRAEKRRASIEQQLNGSKYGIAYADATERITQLNRPVENNLMKQVEYLTTLAYSQLGITTSIMDGTADEKTMLNYTTRVIEPIVSAIVDEMKRKFLTETAISQKKSIMFFKDPFKLVPVNDIAEIADKFTRNEICTSNEIRQIVGMKPASDPSADELRNKNLSEPAGMQEKPQPLKQEQDIKEEE